MRSALLTALVPALAFAGCVAPSDLEGEGAIGGKADSASLALEGTREGDGVLRLLNDGEGTTFERLDIAAGLDRRAAENLIAHRDGPDGAYGTDDDDLFDTISEVDAVRWVGPSALERLTEFARDNDYVPGDNTPYGTIEGVTFTYLEAESVLAFANDASAETLREANVPSRSVTSIVEGRPIESLSDLAGLYWVGPRTLEHLKAAVSTPVDGAICETAQECGSGYRCEGRAAATEGGTRYGKFRATGNYAGFQDDCDADADCIDDGICIAASVYNNGYCAPGWMRDTFELVEDSSIPGVVMSEPSAHSVTVIGQASVPEDVFVDVDLEHTDASSLWIGLQPPTGQEPVTLWDGATMEGPMPSHFVDRGVYRDDGVNGPWSLLVQNVGGRGEGTLRSFTLTVSSRWD